jgi:hypothetical protein
MSDGGGIHTIGRSYNTSVARNYFHHLAAGVAPSHAQAAQSIVYVDNWSCGLAVRDNVVDACPHTKQGYYYFQNARIALAHHNTLDGLWVRDGGTISGHGVPCNCSNVVVVPNDQPLPAEAQAIVRAAGPRPTA